jgi:hypothetical protein
MDQFLLNNIDSALREFKIHSLNEIRNSVLMDRVDSKFVVPVQLLPDLLQGMCRDYSLLNVDGQNQSEYLNVYFDTDDFSYYRMHHNGKLNRIKVRHRHYLSSNSAFLEIKFKSNKGRTIKTRREASLDANKAIEEHADFLADFGIDQPQTLVPRQIVRYQRICLSNETLGERVTLDLNACFTAPDTGYKVALDDVVIIELKQRKVERRSPFYRLLRSLGIRSQSFSKYCGGVSLTMNNKVKTNRFRRDINKLAKISSSIRTITP